MMDVVKYIRSFFTSSIDEPRKRRATDDINFYTSPKYRRLNNNPVSKMDDDFISPVSPGVIKRPTIKVKYPSSYNRPVVKETIVLEDDTSPRNSNSLKEKKDRFRFTSTPQVKQNDVILLGDIKSSNEKKKLTKSSGMGYIKPFSNLKIPSQLEKKRETKPTSLFSSLNFNKFKMFNGNHENFRWKRPGISPTLAYTTQLEDKKDFQTLLESHISNVSSHDKSMYFTPMSRLSRYDCSSGRSQKILDMINNTPRKKLTPKTSKPAIIDLTCGQTNGDSSGKLSVKETIKKVLGSFENETVEIQDSESDIETLPNPPSPKPDIKVDPINSLKTVVDTSYSTKKKWLTDREEEHKRLIEGHAREVRELQENARHLSAINKDIRIGNLTSKVNRCLVIKDSVLPIIELEPELPELTDKQLSMVQRAFTGNPNEILAKKFSLNITRKDILTLAGLNWLNDEVINFYMNLIMERSKEDDYPKAHCFNTFFYPKLIKDGPESLRRWTRRIDLFTMDIICVPIHLGVHWCMAIIDFRDQSIRYYDSMGSNNKKCLEALRNYLQSEHMDKKKERYDTSDFVLENVKDIPQQMNGSDCGMFSCTFAEYYSRDAKFTFKQEDMPYFRSKMVVEIIIGELLIQ